MPERVILQAPERQEWQVPEEIGAGGDALVVRDRRKLVPYGRQLGEGGDVVIAIGPRGVLVHPVGEGLGGRRAEVVVERRVVLREGPEDGQIRDSLGGAVGGQVRVETGRERVRRSGGHARLEIQRGGTLQEAVHLAEVVLDQPPFPTLFRVAVPAALEVRGKGGGG